MKTNFAILCAAAVVFAVPQSLSAHVQVTASTPAAGATAERVRTVTLSFSDALDPAQTATEIVMTAMPGVESHGLMYIRNFTPAWSDDKRTLTLTLRQPLRAGSYTVRWQSTGMGDGHRMSGEVSFEVR
jgi:hypothetical protein